MIHRGSRAQNGMAIVAVDTLELDLLAVEVQDTVLDLNMTEAHLHGNRLVAAGDEQGVEARLLVVPQLGVIHQKVNGSLPLDEEASRLDLHTARTEELVLHQSLPVQGDLGGAEAAGIGLVEGGTGVDIHDMDGIAEEEEHLAEDARPAELILILQVSAVAPFQHEDLNEVLPCTEVLGDLQLRGHVGNLAVPHELPVDEEVEAGVHTLEVDVDRLPLQHGGMKLDGTAVEAAGVIVGNEGRVYGDGVDHVDVVGGIVAAPQHGLPGAWDIDLLAVGGKAVCGEVGDVAEGLVEGEVPVAAEGEEAVGGVAVAAHSGLFALIGDEIGAGSLAVHVERGGILMVVRLEYKLIHDDFFLSKMMEESLLISYHFFGEKSMILCEFRRNT